MYGRQQSGTGAGLAWVLGVQPRASSYSKALTGALMVLSRTLLMFTAVAAPFEGVPCLIKLLVFTCKGPKSAWVAGVRAAPRSAKQGLRPAVTRLPASCSAAVCRLRLDGTLGEPLLMCLL